jgi:hypothetical protein
MYIACCINQQLVEGDMSLFSARDREFALAVSNLSYCNPFLTERIDCERAALGPDFHETDAHWNTSVEMEGTPPNVTQILQRVERLVDTAREGLADGSKVAQQELTLYQDMVLFLLFHRYISQFDQTLPPVVQDMKRQRMGFYREFAKDYERYLAMPGITKALSYEPAHVFACFFQLRRAFHHIFRYIIGASSPAVRLRAAVWQSVFTHDIRCYRRSLYDKMSDITTLITGPSGTGKELVARAIGLSR